MAVDFVRMQQERQRWNNRNQMQEPPKPVANQKLEDVISTWPDANTPVAVRCSDYMFRPHQLWTFTPVPEAGGYLSAPYFKITIAGTDRALTATADKELATVAYHGGAEQLWRVEQLTDGTYRIMPKEVPGIEGVNTRYCLYSAADSTPTLAVYDFSSDNSKWNIRNH
jgi:arabinan endo-1,5-alpha-L-arabinosidase